MASENKTTVYLKEDVLADLRQIGILYERSLSWLLLRAWAIAREKLWEEARDYAKAKVNSHPLGTLASALLSVWGALDAAPHLPDSLWLLCVAVGFGIFMATVYGGGGWTARYRTVNLFHSPLPAARYRRSDDGAQLLDRWGRPVSRESAAVDLLRELGPVGLSRLAGELCLTTKQATHLVRRLEANGVVVVRERVVARFCSYCKGKGLVLAGGLRVVRCQKCKGEGRP